MIVRHHENIADLVQKAFTPESMRQARYYRLSEIPAFSIPLLDNHLEVTQIYYDGGAYHRSYWLADVCEIKFTLTRYLKINAMSRGYVIDINSPHFQRFWENLYYRKQGTTAFPSDTKGVYFCCDGTAEVLVAMGFENKPLLIRKSADIVQICDELGIEQHGMDAAFVMGPLFTKVYSTIADDIGTLIAIRYPELVINPDAYNYTQHGKRKDFVSI